MSFDIDTADRLLQDDTLSLRTIAFLLGRTKTGFEHAYTRATGSTPGSTRPTVPHEWPDDHVILELAIPKEEFGQIAEALLRNRKDHASVGAALAALIIRGDTCPPSTATAPPPPPKDSPRTPAPSRSAKSTSGPASRKKSARRSGAR